MFFKIINFYILIFYIKKIKYKIINNIFFFIIKIIFFCLFYVLLISFNNKFSFSIEEKYKSKFFNNRIKFLVIHYTALNLKKSLKILTEKKVSSHYLIPDNLINGNKKIFLLTKEAFRAWHAGNSSWQERNNINDISIGIEIVNLGYKKGVFNKRCWIPFTNYQIKILIELAKVIINKYNIDPTGIVGHNDIAPGRKVDPGPLFPWKILANNGIGAWYDTNRVHNIILNIEKNKIDIFSLQNDLKKYGYELKITGKIDKQTKAVLQSFQMHFRPNNFSGIPDIETVAILKNLIEKYRKNI